VFSALRPTGFAIPFVGKEGIEWGTHHIFGRAAANVRLLEKPLGTLQNDTVGIYLAAIAAGYSRRAKSVQVGGDVLFDEFGKQNVVSIQATYEWTCAILEAYADSAELPYILGCLQGAEAAVIEFAEVGLYCFVGTV